VLRLSATLLAGLVCVAASGQVLKDQPLPLPGGAGQHGEAAAAVQFLYPDKVNIPAHRTAEIDLHFRVADGLHINSHAPTDKYLVPARLAVVEVEGLNVTAVDFPPGTEYVPQFAPKEKLSVYSGEFILHAHLRAQQGEHLLEGALRYQACDANSCMPPHTIPVSITVVAQ
jgi:Disulphide bond corrector protein DsbC